MIEVIQIYKSKKIFTKSSYTSKNRKEFHDIEIVFNSTNGYLEKDTLFLPIGCKNYPDIKTADLIIVRDTEGDKSLNDRNLFAFRQLSTAKSFDIFKIRKSENNLFELEIDYTKNSMEIGIPKRENHKFYDLKKFKPIRYMINGKSDFNISGRKERTFYEFNFFIEWIGTASNIEFLDLNKIAKSKIIPIENSKTIDERKILK